MTRDTYAHTSGLLMEGVWKNNLVKFEMTFLNLRGYAGQGCPGEQKFETCKKHGKMKSGVEVE